MDIVTELAPTNIQTIFPRVASPGFAELTICRRQTLSTADDLLLARWFSGQDLGPGDDEIFDKLTLDKDLSRIRFVQWNKDADILKLITIVITQELGLSSEADSTGFETSLGGMKSGDFVYFNIGSAQSCDSWQLLSPVRGNEYGTVQINRTIQKIFREKTKTFATSRLRKIPYPMGPEGILYGDKVINVANKRRFNVFPKEGSLQYVANGEIGLVVGMFRKNGQNWKGRLPLNVEFSSQPKFSYSYFAKDFKEEANPLLELAYGITIHKSQGSEFKLTIVVIPNPCRLLSRELLYTALTRHKDKVVIIHQGTPAELKKFSSDFFSETAGRLTNLFSNPDLVPVEDRFFEKSLINWTAKKELVRSKSEVIIADDLYSEGIDYVYEKKLVGNDGSEKYPDFTIEDSDTGEKYFWEHLGMLTDKGYRERWEKKLAWYKQQDILSFEEGGGANGILIVTRDSPEGGINSSEIKRLIQKIFK